MSHEGGEVDCPGEGWWEGNTHAGVDRAQGRPDWAGFTGPAERGLCEGLPQPLPERIQKHPPIAGSTCLLLWPTLTAQGIPWNFSLPWGVDYNWLDCHIPCDMAPGTHMWILGSMALCLPSTSPPSLPSSWLTLAPSIRFQLVHHLLQEALTPCPSQLRHPCL